MLQSLQEQGQLEPLLQELKNPPTSAKEEHSSGSTHDGSKRRLFSPNSLTADGGFEFLTCEQGYDKANRTEHQEIPVDDGESGLLPPGVKSVSERGHAICDLPKHKAHGWSYDEMIAQASSNTDVKSYWAGHEEWHDVWQSQINWNHVGRKPVYFPGSSDVRRFK